MKVGLASVVTVSAFSIALLAIGSLWLLSAESRPASAPVDLTLGATTEVEFKAAWTETYLVEIELDRREAEQLFPCSVDVYRSGPECVGARLPVLMETSLYEGGANVSNLVTPQMGVPEGGTYSDRTYSWTVASADLQRGAIYRLAVRSEVDGTAAMQARPRLLVRLHPHVGKSEGTLRMLIALAAALVGAIGLAWIGTTYAVRRWRKRQQLE